MASASSSLADAANAGLSRTRARRSTGVLAGVALALALPLAVAYAREAELGGGFLARLSPIVAVLEQARGASEPWALALGLAALGGLVALVARARRGVGALVLLAVLFYGTASEAKAQESARAVELVGVHPLLGPRARKRLYLPFSGKVPESDVGLDPSQQEDLWKLTGGYRHLNGRLRALVGDPVTRRMFRDREPQRAGVEP